LKGKIKPIDVYKIINWPYAVQKNKINIATELHRKNTEFNVFLFFDVLSNKK
jgi:hypothetical protein